MITRHRRRTSAVVALTCAAAAASAASGQTTNNPFAAGITPGVTVRVGTYATIPNSGGAAPRMNDAAVSPDGRFFIADQRGTVYSTGTGGATGTATPYINLNTFGLGLLNDNGERGLASIAFHPQFTTAGAAGFGKFYASFSTSDTAPPPDYEVAGQGSTHDEVVYEFTAANPLASTYSGSVPREVLRIAHPQVNHNGGGLKFNPNAAPGSADFGALYYSTGDGGGGGDPYQQGQNDNALLGKILRIDPLARTTNGKYGIVASNAFAADGNPNTRGEIYATGFRNPQKFAWDRGGTGRMLVGDIGQGVVEEIDVVTNGGDYGWGTREGSFTYVNGNTVALPPNPDNSGFIRPIVEYDHGEGVSITGGFVYRGTAIPELTGKYLFGDLAAGRIFYVDADTVASANLSTLNSSLRELFLSTDGTNSTTLLALIDAAAAGTQSRADLRFGQDAAGNIYLLNKQDGFARVLLPAMVPEPASLAAIALVGGVVAVRRRR